MRGRFALRGLASTFAGPGTPASVAELFLSHQFVTTIAAGEARRRGCPFGWCVLFFRASLLHRLISHQRRKFRFGLFHGPEYCALSRHRLFPFKFRTPTPEPGRDRHKRGAPTRTLPCFVLQHLNTSAMRVAPYSSRLSRAEETITTELDVCGQELLPVRS
jgi:hypothetical protein